MVEDINEIDPGRLRHRVEFQHKNLEKDSQGHPLPGWIHMFFTNAEIVPVSGRELIAAQQIQGEVTHRVRCRYRSGVTAANRIVYKGRVFDIAAPINAREENVMLEILCKEGLTNG